MNKHRRTAQKLIRLVFWLLVLQTVLICGMMLVGKTRAVDLLVITIPDSRLFDPDLRLFIRLFRDVELASPGFSTSVNGQIALSIVEDGQVNLYIWDMHAPHAAPVNITGDIEGRPYPLSWSRDGRLLAFSVETTDARQIYVWDGETITDITPDIPTPALYYNAWASSWSDDGRLAFLAWMNNRGGHEIYLWDGQTTMNISQNPDGDDRSPAWNTDGQLAFLSLWDGEYDIYVWDGVSFNNGIPDRDSFINVAPELTNGGSYPTWTNTGLLAFSGIAPGANNAQIYVWDGQSVTNISQTPALNTGWPLWNADGQWAYIGYTASQITITVHDAANRTLLTTPGLYPPVWSTDGYLMFCTYGWSLNLWNGHHVVTVTEGNAIYAHWQSGADVVCSSG